MTRQMTASVLGLFFSILRRENRERGGGVECCWILGRENREGGVDEVSQNAPVLLGWWDNQQKTRTDLCPSVDASKA